MDVNCAVHHPCTANFQYTKMKKPALKTVLSSNLQYLSVYTLFSWLQSACLFYSICFYLCVSSHLSISICPSVLILLLLSDYSLLSSLSSIFVSILVSLLLYFYCMYPILSSCIYPYLQSTTHLACLILYFPHPAIGGLCSTFSDRNLSLTNKT